LVSEPVARHSKGMRLTMTNLCST